MLAAFCRVSRFERERTQRRQSQLVSLRHCRCCEICSEVGVGFATRGAMFLCFDRVLGKTSLESVFWEIGRRGTCASGVSEGAGLIDAKSSWRGER